MDKIKGENMVHLLNKNNINITVENKANEGHGIMVTISGPNYYKEFSRQGDRKVLERDINFYYKQALLAGKEV